MNARTTESEIYNSVSLALSCTEIEEKCNRLTKVIDTSGTHHLNTIFSSIVEDIFFSRVYSWGLTRNNHVSNDFMYLRNFLSHNGPVFRLIDRMQSNGVQTNCPISFSALPDHLKTNYQRSFPPEVKMSGAFESFFSYFALFITKPIVNRTPELFPASFTHSPTGQEDCLYFVLLDDYLCHFFPTEPDSVPPTLTTSVTANSYKVPRKAHSSVTKASLLLRHDTSRHSSPGQVSYNEPWCCDTLVQLFSEFWLEEYQGKSEPGDSGRVRQRPIPTENHVRAIRLLVKHVHYFHNAHLENPLVKRFQNDSILEQINQGMINKLQPKLFHFLEFCFNTWPLDRNFRIVLETWLSYIQPWRYHKGSSTASEFSLKPEWNITNMWYQFVFLNIHFYTKLFKLVIKRFIRMDVSSAANSILLFRVAKIYGQQNLVTLIDQAEETTALPSFQTSGNYASYIGSPQHSKTAEVDEDISIFSAGFTNVMKQLLLVIAQAVDVNKSSSHGRDSGWVTQAVSFFGYAALTDHTPNRRPESPADKKKTVQNLQFALETFSNIYDLPIPAVDRSRSRSSVGMDEDIADHVIDERGKKVLTPTGRSQLMNNQKKFPLLQKTSRELQPICSYENAFLVRTLYTFSSRFNTKYETEMEQLCSKKDFLGKICNQIFYRSEDTGKPYISLRFVAHYKNLFYILFLYFLSLLFGFNFFVAVIYLLLFASIYVVVLALTH